jgi:hypothetical protein
MNDIQPPRSNLHRLGLVFTGHMIDAPGRKSPRFSPEMERLAADAIRAEVRAAHNISNGSLIGFASGARGGDILFHEICLAEGIPTRLVLPFDAEAFLTRSVCGVTTGSWETRFRRIWDQLGPAGRLVLDLGKAKDPFGACNDAMLTMVRAQSESIELLALWDGAGTSKLGGTAAFVERVRSTRGNVRHIDSRTLLAALQMQR